MKRILILIDAQNFTNSIVNTSKIKKQDRIIDWWKINNFVLEYLKNNIQYKEDKLTHLRTYYYTGEVTESLLSKINFNIKKVKGKDEEKFLFDKEKAEKIKKGFEEFEKKANNYYFFEIRKKPLQYSPNKGIFQKGVDVQIAVDLVSQAYLNTYDILVLFSGDIDLYESLITIKNLGKHVLIFSSESVMAKELIRTADMYVNFDILDDKLLDLFTHIYVKKTLKDKTN